MFLAAILFFFGLIVGSFLNAFIYRYQTKKTMRGRSFCPACKHTLAWYDLVPVFSWLFLSRRCRYCRSQISLQYPLVEFLTGVIFFLTGFFSEPAQVITSWITQISNFLSEISTKTLIFSFLTLIILIFIMSCLILIAVYDQKTKEIPNGFNLTFIGASLIYISLSMLFFDESLISGLWSLASGMLAFLFFYSFVYISKETWMGGGDAKLAFGMGIFLGPVNTFIAIFLATWIGAVAGVGFLIIQKTKLKKGNSKLNHEIPFGPFLVLGTLLAFFLGSQIFSYYAKIFLEI